MSFRVRLTAYYTALLSAILLALGGLVYPIMAAGIYGEIDSSLRLAANQASSTLHYEGDIAAFEESHERDVEIASLEKKGSGAVLLDARARIVDKLGSSELIPVPRSDEITTGFSTIRTKFGETRLYTLSVPSTGGWLQVALSLEGARATMRRLAGALALLIPMGIAMSAAGGLFLAGRALRPVDRITKTAREIGGQDLGRRLNLDLPQDEIGRLATTFDEMLDRIQTAFRRQQEFTADAAHELRTPLAVIKGNIGVALNRERTGREYASTLERLETEVDRLTNLVEELLLIARLDDPKESKAHMEPLNLSELISAVIDQLRSLALEKEISFSSDFPPSLSYQGDSAQLIRMLYNLVDNAVRYTPLHGTIGMRAASNGGNLVIEVTNSGPGISAADLPFVFERFFRVDRSRSRSGSSSGLGLSISRAIAVAHQGNISVTSAPGDKTTFTALLPLAP